MKNEAKQIELFSSAMFTETDGREIDSITMEVIKHAVNLNDLAWKRIKMEGEPKNEIHC